MWGKMVVVGGAFWCLTTLVSAQTPGDWAEGSEGLDDGATRDYYNRAALLEWQHRLGDWRDCQDVPQGHQPYAETIIRQGQVPTTVAWVVTPLVNEWLNGRHPNQGFFLRCLGPSAAVVFASREALPAAHRPKLILEGEQGRVELDAVADTFLTPSTYRSMGHRTELRVSGQPEHALLRFSLEPAAQIGKLVTAKLQLVVVAQHGDSRIGVFRCRQGHDADSDEVQYGLAARYPEDQGIRQDPAVWFFADFESTQWEGAFSSVAPRTALDVVLADEPRAFVPWQGQALRVRMAKGQNTALNATVQLRRLLPNEPDEVYFRYYLRFADDWNQSVSDGKLPGLSGTYGIAGWGGRRSDGTNGWSARGLFRRTIPPGNPLAGTTPIGYYCYHADMPGTYGDHWVWQIGYRGYLEKNRWYCIEQYVKLNTPGQRDGILRAWVDGRLAFEKTDVRFRTVERLHVEQLWLNVYHGGTAVSPYDQHCFLDNIVLASEYIGPMLLAKQSLP